MVVITVECMNREPHKAHSWREGFLWHRKRECGGVPAWLKPFPKDILTPNECRFMAHQWPTPTDLIVRDYCSADVDLTTALYEEMKHRHNYAFDPERSDKLIMVWHCLDPFCKAEYFRFRSLYNSQTRTNDLKFLYWLWR